MVGAGFLWAKEDFSEDETFDGIYNSQHCHAFKTSEKCFTGVDLDQALEIVF